MKSPPRTPGEVAANTIGWAPCADLLPARQDRPVGLGDGAGRDRVPVEVGKGLGNRPPDLLLHQRPHRVGVRGRDVLLETGGPPPRRESAPRASPP